VLLTRVGAVALLVIVVKRGTLTMEGKQVFGDRSSHEPSYLLKVAEVAIVELCIRDIGDRSACLNRIYDDPVSAASVTDEDHPVFE